MKTQPKPRAAKIQHLPWLYQGKPFEEIPEGAWGFIYYIQYFGSHPLAEGSSKYVGKKQFVTKTSRKLPAHKQVTAKGAPRKNLLRKRGLNTWSWKTYYGSNKPLEALFKIEPPELFRRTILCFAYSRRELTYLEDKNLFCSGVLESDEYFNRNIGSRHYRAFLAPLLERSRLRGVAEGVSP